MMLESDPLCHPGVSVLEIGKSSLRESKELHGGLRVGV